MPLHSLRIVFLCSADSYRGSAVSLMHLAHGLTARHASVRVITGSDAVAGPLRAGGVDVGQFDLSSTNLRTAGALRRALAEFGAEVLIVDRPRDLRLGLLATIGSSVALVNRYNSHRPLPPQDILTRLAYRFGVRETIFLTQEMSERILKAAPWMRRVPHRVIAEGVDAELFRPDAEAGAAFRQAHALGHAPFVLAVGALTREKRGEFLIEALSRVPAAPLLLFCGEGPMQASLAAQAEQLHVPVRFLGIMPRDALRGAFNAAAAMVHACDVETFGLSVLEAMACGCPVIGVRAGGLLEVVGTDGAAGLLVAPDDPGEMATKLREILLDSKLAERVRLAARQRAAEQFPLSRMSDRYESAAVSAWLSKLSG